MRLAWIRNRLSGSQAAAPGDGAEVARARYAVQLASMFSEWVHRRVETIEFPNADVVRRRMSVDFSMLPTEAFREGDPVYVPLMILRKAPLRNFDLRDAAGVPQQMLTTAENGAVSVLGLDDWLWPGARTDPGGLNEALRKTVGEPDARLAYAMTAQQLSRGALGDALRNLPAGDATRRAIRGLIKELAGGFLLLVPMAFQPRKRQLVKFSYDASRRQDHRLDRDRLLAAMEPADRALVEAVFGAPAVGKAGRRYREARKLFSQTGVAARLEDIENIQLGWSQSYHVELVPPEGMRVAEATLEPQGQPPQRDGSRFRPHMHVRDQARESVGQVSLLLHAQRDALVFPLAFSAAVIAAVLAVLPQRLGDLDVQTMAALLLLPSALAAFYVRSSEHSYVTAALRLLRIIAVVPVLAGLLALAMLGLGYLSVDSHGRAADATALDVAEWAARVAVLAAVLLFAALFAPPAGGAVRAVTRRTEEALTAAPAWVQRAAGVALALLGLAIAIALLGGALWLLYSVLGV